MTPLMRRWPASFVVVTALAAAQVPPSGSAAEDPVRFLTSDPGVTDYWPCFSPDGALVLFSRSRDGGKTWELFVVPSAGGEARRFARSSLPLSGTRASWSPRLNTIAFTGTSAEGKSAVWLINGDGTQPRALESSGLSDRALYPSWYPDGAHLAVLDGREQAIKRLACKDGTVETVTDPRKVLTGMASVSPDGEWMAFAGQENTGLPYDQTKNAIWLLSRAGSLRPLEGTPGPGRAPAWSRGGEWLAFQSTRGSSNGSSAAFVIRRDGTGVRQVTAYELDANHPVWSPDARSLACAARRAKDAKATGIAIIELAR
jgi:Tol biopolymer transport system component